jgi:hypothetical protein
MVFVFSVHFLPFAAKVKSRVIYNYKITCIVVLNSFALNPRATAFDIIH